MAFDSSASLLLFAACVGAWGLTARARAGSRLNIRFAAMLFAAFSVARLLGLLWPQFSLLAAAVALIGLSLGATALALGLLAFLARPLPAGAAALALSLSLGAGLAAALSGAPAYALCCAIPGVALSIAAALGAYPADPARAALALMAGLSLLLGGLALMDGALAAAELFFAATLVGAARASQKRIEVRVPKRHPAIIGFRG